MVKNVTSYCPAYYKPSLQVDGCLLFIALMMEAARTSETLVNFYQTTRRYNPKDSHLRTHSRENLKSYIFTSGFERDDNSQLILHIIR
jgi:hypothetical protein